MNRKQPCFILCVRSEGAEDLEPRKVYEALPDAAAAREGYARVIDESGEDYLYPSEYFVPVKLPAAVQKQFAAPSRKSRPVSGVRGRESRTRLRAMRS